MSRFLYAAGKLHDHITANYWTDEGLIGPDPGIRLNYRIGRFLKSYLSFLRWHERLYYVQGQGYWILGNWTLFDLTGEEKYREIALQCSKYLLQHQRDDGAWEYPNPEWKGRLATVEGTWGSMGLLETYRHTGDKSMLNGMERWYQFLTERIGFQQSDDTLAINYFAHLNDTSSRVPNVSISLLRFLTELSYVTDDMSYMKHSRGILKFLEGAQCENGEFPYSIPGVNGTVERPHLQCYQYNAFECLNLLRYFELTDDETALPMIKKLLSYLEGGLSDSGHCHYDCGNSHRTFTYHTAAMAATFLRAHQFGLADYSTQAELAYNHVLNLQKDDGSFPHSRGDYRLFKDTRSYPRYLSMMLYHLLHPETPPKKEISLETSTASKYS